MTLALVGLVIGAAGVAIAWLAGDVYTYGEPGDPAWRWTVIGQALVAAVLVLFGLALLTASILRGLGCS